MSEFLNKRTLKEIFGTKLSPRQWNAVFNKASDQFAEYAKVPDQELQDMEKWERSLLRGYFRVSEALFATIASGTGGRKRGLTDEELRAMEKPELNPINIQANRYADELGQGALRLRQLRRQRPTPIRLLTVGGEAALWTGTLVAAATARISGGRKRGKYSQPNAA